MNKIIRKIGIAAGAVVMTGFAAPLLIPIPPLEGMVPPESLADPDSRFIRIGKIKVHFKCRGNRPPILLLLHGHLGGTFCWNETMDALAGIGTAIAYDRPAFGLTSRPMPGEWKGLNPYGLEAQVRLLIEFMDALDIPRATLIAHAMGCAVAVLAASSHADRVENLVLVSPEARPGGRPAWQRLFMATPQMRRLGPVLLRKRVVGQIEELLHRAWHDPSLISSDKRDAYYKILRLNDWDRALWETARTTIPSNRAFPNDKIQAPTLVVTGDDDRIEGTREIIRLAATIPQAHLAVLPDAGHSPHEESPSAFLQALDEYLAAASESVP